MSFSAKGSGAHFDRLYKDDGAPTNEWSPFAYLGIVNHFLFESEAMGSFIALYVHIVDTGTKSMESGPQPFRIQFS